MTDINTSNTLTLNLTEESTKAFSKFIEDLFPEKEKTAITDEMIRLFTLMQEMNTTKTYMKFKNGVKFTCEIDLSEYHEDKQS